MQIYLNRPSRAIYSQFLAQVELTGKPLNVWNTINFPLNSTLVTALLKSGYTDLVITVVLNVQVPTTGTYYLDNLRFLPVAGNGCNGLPNGTSCTDSNACTVGDTCQSNVCKPGTAVTCSALDQCHTAGLCSPSTGECSNPVKSNGSPCDDGNVCTQGDSCQNGVCKGSGTCGPSFSATPSTIDFGSLILTGIGSQELTVTNNGTAAGTPSFSIAGSNPTEFAVTASPNETNPCTSRVVPGSGTELPHTRAVCPAHPRQQVRGDQTSGMPSSLR